MGGRALIGDIGGCEVRLDTERGIISAIPMRLAAAFSRRMAISSSETPGMATGSRVRLKGAEISRDLLCCFLRRWRIIVWKREHNMRTLEVSCIFSANSMDWTGADVAWT